jgi:hypothetical protein
MWQALLVGLIVLVATLYVAWALMPAATRIRMARSFAAWTRQGNRPRWLIQASARLENAARGGGCEDCSAGQSLTKPREGKRDHRH